MGGKRMSEAVVELLPRELQRERAGGVDRMEVSPADSKLLGDVVTVERQHKPLDRNRGAIVVRHPHDPVMRDTCRSVLGSLIPGVRGNRVRGDNLYCENAVRSVWLKSPSATFFS